MQENKQNLSEFFVKGSKVLVYLRDFGSANLFINIVNDLNILNLNLDLYSDNIILTSYLKNIEPSLSILEISKLNINYKSYNYLIICQNSFVSEKEIFLTNIFKKIYIIQDYFMDFKFENFTYFSPFKYQVSIQKKYNCIYFKNLKSNKILNKNLKIVNNLMIIGSQYLLESNKNIDFLMYLISKINIDQIIYKPHPMENITPLFDLNIEKIKIVSNLKEIYNFPRYIISPFSSLGYDIPEYLNTINNEKLHILHGFGLHYKKELKSKFPKWNLMVSELSINYLDGDLPKFINKINSNE